MDVDEFKESLSRGMSSRADMDHVTSFGDLRHVGMCANDVQYGVVLPRVPIIVCDLPPSTPLGLLTVIDFMFDRFVPFVQRLVTTHPDHFRQYRRGLGIPEEQDPHTSERSSASMQRPLPTDNTDI